MKKYDNPSYMAFEMSNGLQFDHSHSEFPTLVHSWNHLDADDYWRDVLRIGKHSSTCYIYVYEDANITRMLNPQGDVHSPYLNDLQTYLVKAGMYLSVSGQIKITGGKGVIIERLGHNVPFTMGGPIERIGRLNYIDGCTDSLLIPPVMKGDSCFNHLHFPQGINQTAHTHPSLRTGIVAKGNGYCITPWGEIPLNEGDVFCILPDQKDQDGNLQEITHEGVTALIGTHSFRTEDSEMDVIAYHPDSDFGAEHEVHPMINRTIVDGKPASENKDILSKVWED